MYFRAESCVRNWRKCARGTRTPPGVQARFVGEQHHRSELRTSLGEGDIADAVRELAGSSKGVHIGSYPMDDSNAPGSDKVKVVVTGRSRERVDDVIAQLQPILHMQPATR